MFPKLIAILIGMAVMTYCQDHHHHHHTTSHQSVVTHEIPKKVEHHYQEHKAIPVAHHTHAIHGHAGHIHATHNHVQAAPKLFIPVHEIVQEVAPSPAKHVAIQAPVHRVPIQIPVQHVPIQTPVQHIPIQIPVQHVPIQIPVQHVPIPIPVHQVTVQVPVQHHVAQASHHEEAHHKESHHEESHHEESHHGDHHDEHIDYYAHPKYEYEYKVEDPHTGDKKYQHETRDGDVVKGVYSLHEPDGSIRTVKYSSDKKSGFNADIVHKGHSTHEYNYHH